jgi:hypothetical protein
MLGLGLVLGDGRVWRVSRPRRRSGGRGGPRGGAGALSCTPQATAFLIGIAVLRRHFQAM